MEGTDQPVNSWVNADNAADEAKNSQLRKERLITVRQKERLRTQAQCQARQRIAENHMLSRKHQRRLTEELDHDRHLQSMLASHAAALQQANQAQEKARIVRQAAEQAEASVHARAAARRADAKQRFAKAVSKVKTERKRVQECVDSRSQRMARTRAAEKQRAAHQVKLAQATRRCSLRVDARRQEEAVPHPAISGPRLEPSGPQVTDSLSLLRKQRATARGRAALRKARQQRRADELSRQLQCAEHAKQLFRKQHGEFTGPRPGFSDAGQTQETRQPLPAPASHKQASCAAQPITGSGAAETRPGKPHQLAEQGCTSQRAALGVIAQTQWELKSLRLESHNFIMDNAGYRNSTRALSPAGVHASPSSSKPFLEGMVRNGTPERAGSNMLSKATYRGTMIAKLEADLPKARPAAARDPSGISTAAVKQLQRLSTAKRAQKSGLKHHADRVLPSHLPVSVLRSTKKTKDCSVSTSPMKGSLLSACSHSRRPAISPACAVSTDVSRSAPAHSLSGEHQSLAPLQASVQLGRRGRAFHAEQAKANHPKPLVTDDTCRQIPFASAFPDHRAGPDIAGAVYTEQHANCTGCPVRKTSHCPPSEDLLWPALLPEGVAHAMPQAAEVQQEGRSFLFASPDDVPRQALTVTPHPLLQPNEAAAASCCSARSQEAGMPTSAAEENPDIFSHNTSLLNAAAEQLQAVCRQLLQGLAIPNDLQSSLDAMQGAGVRQYSRGTDVLAGLVSDLEADMALALA